MTTYFLDVLTIIFLFFVYGFIHSLLASNKVKIFIVKSVGELIAFYRLAYNILSILLLYVLYDISPQPNLVVYELKSSLDLIILLPQFLSLVGILWMLKYIDLKEFLGVNQIFRFLNKEYEANELDEKLTLRITGPYRISRHPVYLFSILFLLFRPTMDLFYVTMFLCVIAYFYVGSFYEEKKLVAKFGRIYLDYQKAVPRIWPLKIFKPYPVLNNLQDK
jgi:protein-S-isoprenylcysteine O-methyltransferase Ste14